MVNVRGAASGPVGAGERSALLDSLRGWALLGILAANMVWFIGFGAMSEDQRGTMLLAQFDDVSEFLIEWLVVGKFYALFSLLFGIGFAIQIGRLEQRGEGASRYLRRLTILFLIGIAHLLLLWFGDILALYALMGAVLLLFRRTPDRALVIWAVILWLVPIGWSAAIHFGGFQPDGPFVAAGTAAVTSAGLDLSQGPLPFFREASYLQTLAVNPGAIFFRIGGLVYEMRFTKVLGMFLIGLWIGRRAIHSNPEQWRALLRRAAKLGLAIGLPLSAAKAVLLMWPGERPAIELAAEVAYCLGTPTLAIGYAAVFTLLWLGVRKAAVELAAPAGRMALTNYLMQTVLQSILFYGWGFGLIGKLSLVFVVPISIALFALQIVYSRWWLGRYRFGPVEWLWRSATYGCAQPMRLKSPGSASAPAR